MELYHLSSVKGYLDSLFDTDFVGIPRSPHHCLVARAWQYEHHGQKVEVDTTCIDVVESGNVCIIATPDEEVGYLIDFFDTLFSAPTKSFFLLQLKEQRPDLYAYFVKEEVKSDATA